MNRYKEKIDSLLEEFKKLSEENCINMSRYYQLIEVSDIIKNHFLFDDINFIETGTSQSWDDGCSGYFFSSMVREFGGSFTTVDNDKNFYENGIKFYNNNFKNIEIENVLDDSVNYIKNTTKKFNLVFLDSWDLDLNNPFMSMLHTWREFEALQDKIDKNGLVIIDDNYFYGSWVEWNTYVNNVIVDRKKIDITHPIIGKGTLVYHYCEDERNGWEILSKDKGHGLKKIVLKKNF